MDNKDTESFVKSVMKNDNISAIKKLEEVLKKKCAKKIDDVLKTSKV